jgi:histidyl-tRNA synthetase
VRGLAYYTGVVFELIDKNRTMRSIAGGGRYDRLVELYGGAETPAAGFATGDVVLAELLKEKNLVPGQPPRSSVFIITFDKDHPEKTIATAQGLRSSGISCEFALKVAGVGKQMKLADSSRAIAVVFIGGDEEKQGKIKVRNMQLGAEELINAEELIEKLKHILGK